MEPRGSLLPHRASLIPSPLASAWEPSAGTVPTALPPGGSPSVGGTVGHRLAWDRRTGEKSREYGRPLSLRGHRVSDGPRVNDGRGTPGRALGLADRRSGGPQGRRLTRNEPPGAGTSGWEGDYDLAGAVKAGARSARARRDVSEADARAAPRAEAAGRPGTFVGSAQASFRLLPRCRAAPGYTCGYTCGDPQSASLIDLSFE